MAEYMMTKCARFVTITARPAPGGECRLDYHWDLDGRLLTFVTTTHQGAIPTISAICPAADWVEREVRDYFAVDFLGRESSDPLMLRPQDQPGVFRRSGDTGQGGRG
jgi:NADH-quinone oxidoreductase subunit C